MNAEQKVFSISELRISILKFIIKPNCCTKCGEKNAVYYKYAYCYPYYCLWCAPKTERWKREVMLYNRAICLRN